jgi:hypothetical protein
MIFRDLGDKKIIEFQEGDTEEQKRMVEQQLAYLRNLFALINKLR